MTEEQGDIQAAIEAGKRETRVIDLLDDLKFIVHPDVEGGSAIEHVDLEHYSAAPRRAKGNATLRDVASFTEYVNRLKDAQTVVFADDKGGMRAVFNHHATQTDPGWRDHSATLARPMTIAFQAWMTAAAGWMSQPDFANFLEERLGEIVEPAGADLMDAAEHFRAHTIVSFRSQQRLRDGQTQLEYTEVVQGGTESEGKLTLPERLTVLLQPFRDSDNFTVQARLRWRVAERRVTFAVLFDDTLENELEGVYDTAVEAVKKETGLPVYRGTDA